MTALILFSILCLLCFFPSVSQALICSQCFSQYSWKHCDDNSYKVECEDDVEAGGRCQTTHRVFRADGEVTEEFSRACTVKKECQISEDECRQTTMKVDASGCKYTCCESDLCNKEESAQPTWRAASSGEDAARGLISVLLMIAYAICLMLPYLA